MFPEGPEKGGHPLLSVRLPARPENLPGVSRETENVAHSTSSPAKPPTTLPWSTASAHVPAPSRSPPQAPPFLSKHQRCGAGAQVEENKSKPHLWIDSKFNGGHWQHRVHVNLHPIDRGDHSPL